MVLLKDLVEEAKSKHKIKRKMSGNKKNRIDKEKSKKNVLRSRVPRKDRVETGFYGVYKVVCDFCDGGFSWYYDDGEHMIHRADFFELKREIEKRNLKWELENRYSAFFTSKDVGYPLYDLLYK